jgi:hypothetical protein
MAQQVINTGTTANDNTGDTLRASWQKANDNFTELYTDISALNDATAYVPTLTDSGGGRTYTYTITSARYTEIGNLRWFSVAISVSNATGTASGDLRLSLPDSSTYAAAVCVQANNLGSNAKTEIEGNTVAGQSYANLVHYESGSTSSLAAHVQAGSSLIITGVYFHAV